MQAQIAALAEENTLKVLKESYASRSYLNTCTVWLTRATLPLHAMALVMLGIGKTYSLDVLLWCGIGVVALAGVLTGLVQQNLFIMSAKLTNIKNILNGTFVDAEVIVKMDNSAESEFENGAKSELQDLIKRGKPEELKNPTDI